MKTVVISQPFFFPWVGLFEQIRLADVFVHFDDVAFSKGSFVNRVQLKSEKRAEWLTVPLKGRHLGQQINDLTADDQCDWRAQHLALLEQLYQTTPHGEEMLALVQALYRTPFARFSDLIIEAIHQVCGYFQLARQTRFVRSSELGVGGSSSQRVLALVQHFGGNRYVTGHGTRNYLDHAAFEAVGVRVEYLDYQCQPYPQRFPPFDPHVSILDLIANVGREGARFIGSPSVPAADFLARTPH